MVDQPDKRTKDCQSDNVPQSDVTGRDRITRNVLASWGGYGVFIVAGFIMPRLIDTRIGQEALGVWDFAWSLVAYFSLVQAGVVSSVNRFVAKYQAVGDLDGVNRCQFGIVCTPHHGNCRTGLDCVSHIGGSAPVEQSTRRVRG